MTQKGKSILVIGGSGFVGSGLIPALVAEGYDIAVLNRGNTPMQGTRQLVADRESATQLQAAAQAVGNFDAVIDTSAYNRHHAATAWTAFSHKTNHWIHLGSAAVYKETLGRHPTEKDPIGGAAIWAEYGVEKSDVDQYLMDNAGRIPVTILRPPYLYGPNNNNDRETFVWARAMQDQPVIVPGNGRTPIQFLHIDDLSDIVKAALRKRPLGVAIYNVAADERPTLSEWVRTVAEVAGFPDPGILAGDHAKTYKPRQYFPFRDYPCCVETGLVKTELNWKARYSLAEGFRQTLGTQDQQSLRTRALNLDVERRILANAKPQPQ
ncbi:MAG: NAD-dependent epimerase/dehydratase family protein [Alphaproteobacteria bacterium]